MVEQIRDLGGYLEIVTCAFSCVVSAAATASAATKTASSPGVKSTAAKTTASATAASATRTLPTASCALVVLIVRGRLILTFRRRRNIGLSSRTVLCQATV